MKTTKFWLTVLALCTVVALQAQGWINVYGAEEPLGAASLSEYPNLVRTGDGKYLLMGFDYQENGFAPDSVALVKVDVNGDLIWSKRIQSINDWYPVDIVHAPSGGFVLCGSAVTAAKLDENGEKIWQKNYSVPDLPEGGNMNSITAAPDGGFVLVGSAFDNSQEVGVALKINANGDLLWVKTYSNFSDNNRFQDVEPTNDGGFIVAGNYYGPNSFSPKAFLLKIDGNGNQIWASNEAPSNFGISKVIVQPDGSFVMAGSFIGKYSSTGELLWSQPLNFDLTGAVRNDAGEFLIAGGVASVDIHLQKLNSEGQTVWIKNFGDPLNQEGGGELLANSDGTLVVSGKQFDSQGLKAGLLLLLTDANGNIFTSAIAGRVHHDTQNDCQPDAAEPGLSGWLVQAVGQPSFAALTDADGNFLLPIDTGAYMVTATAPSPYWGTCNSPLALTVANFGDTTTLDFPAQAIVDCPYLTVDIGASYLSRCSDNDYTVYYCNQGTATAEDAAVEVSLDPWLSYVSSSIPFSSQNGNTLSFQLGDVEVGDCGSFQVTAFLNCDSTVLGQTHCTSAHVLPDSLCLAPDPLWDGSSIEADVSCSGDSIYFIITNVGSGAMSAPLGFIVIEDEIVLMNDDFLLGPGQSTTTVMPANGSTLHLEVQQSPEHPSGQTSTGATIEGCGGWMSLGLFAQWGSDDPDPFTDVDCQGNVGAFAPNENLAFPTGFTGEHFIEPGQDIEYLIRFQNTGTDTASQIVVMDVLPPDLSLASVRPGASSHPYNYSVTPEGVLVFTFEKIDLPGSSSNEAASHGFVRFRASQSPGLGWGNVIANTALIYFDSNTPVQTNTYRHRVGQIYPWTLVGTEPTVRQQKTRVKVVPNPMTDSAVLQVDGIEPGPLRLVLTDAAGQVLRTAEAMGTGFEFQRGELPAGLYFFKIERNGERVGSGKLMVR